MEREGLWLAYYNSFFYMIVGTIVNLTFTISGAYPLSKKRLVGRRLINILIVFTMWFNAGLIPTYLTFKDYGILNTRTAIIFGFACTAYCFILLRTYFSSIPDALEESAKIDGRHLEETEVWQKIKELTNVSLKSVNSKNVSDMFQVFKTLMASGDLPDLTYHQNGRLEFNKYGMEGAFEPVYQLAEKYAPNVKEALDIPDVKAFLTAADGNMYYVAGPGEATVSSGWFVRQDWLDKLGIKSPTNVQEYYSRDIIGDGGMAISASSEKKDIAMKFFDFSFSKIGTRLSNFGIEGKHYDLVDDKEIFRDWVLHGEKTTINILEEAGAQSGFPGLGDFWYEEQWLNESAKAGVRLYLDNNLLVPKFPILSYTPEEDKRFNEIMTSVKTLVDETAQKWVFGTDNVEETYDSFVKKMYQMGLKEAEEIQQAAYDRRMKAAN